MLVRLRRSIAHLAVAVPVCAPVLDATETTDFYELMVERHQKASTVPTSNREPSEWLAMMADPLLAQSAVDRLTYTCHELVIEGDASAA